MRPTRIYCGIHFHHVPTDFEYVDVTSNLGNGWSIDDKAYTYKYYNKQNFNGTTAISATSATDKLNSYRQGRQSDARVACLTIGYVSMPGLWSGMLGPSAFFSNAARSLAHGVDAVLPALPWGETFNTTTLQPYAEYEVNITRQLRVTPGVKLAYYKQDFTQFADNGKTVGSLNGAASVNHVAEYHSWLPSLDAHYLLL